MHVLRGSHHHFQYSFSMYVCLLYSLSSTDTSRGVGSWVLGEGYNIPLGLAVLNV